MPVAAAAGISGAPPAELWWLQGERIVGASPAASPARTPLGSLWKLFVFGYLEGTQAREAPYRCSAGLQRNDEEYCCDPGESVSRDAALTRSCGPYFAPQRLALNPQDWRAFWQRQEAPDWLLDLRALQPATELEVAGVLRALHSVPSSARLGARRALLPNTLRDARVLTALGSGPRFKTWSWTMEGIRVGGAAGWLGDGTPFWFGARGTSRLALETHAGWIGERWRVAGLSEAAADAATIAAQPCVRVAMFARYPLHSVTGPEGRVNVEGPLKGPHRLAFANGRSLQIQAQPVLHLRQTPEGPRLEARLTLEDYVARVIDREGDAREIAAARALAVAARTWLLQNAPEKAGCREVEDSSAAQRVSPQPPSRAARAAAAYTEGLVLQGSDVRYHRDQTGPGLMSWQAAVDMNRRGESFLAILRQAYPAATLSGFDSPGDCVPFPQAARWLSLREHRWRDRLRREPGFEPVSDLVQVCRLGFGVPNSDQRRLLIRLREWDSREGRVTLVHEYLHLAFRHHPRGRDEAYVEQLAQQLVDL